MSDTLHFSTAKRRKNAKPISFQIEGEDHTYVFTPPKTAVMMMPILEKGARAGLDATKSTFDWLGEGLSDEDEQRIIRRLRDPEDDLDVDDIDDITTKLSEQVTGNPTS